MKIAILGGTGRIGEGLATRWATRHNIYIGSRDVEKAKNAACGIRLAASSARYGHICREFLTLNWFFK